MSPFRLVAALSLFSLLPDAAAADTVQLLRTKVYALSKISYEYPRGVPQQQRETFAGSPFVDGIFENVVTAVDFTIPSQLDSMVWASATFERNGETGFRSVITSGAFDMRDEFGRLPADHQAHLAVDWRFRVSGSTTRLHMSTEEQGSGVSGFRLYDETAGALLVENLESSFGMSADVILTDGHTYRMIGRVSAIGLGDPEADLQFYFDPPPQLIPPR